MDEIEEPKKRKPEQQEVESYDNVSICRIEFVAHFTCIRLPFPNKKKSKQN